MSAQDINKLIKDSTYLIFDPDRKITPVFENIFDQYGVDKNRFTVVTDVEKVNEILLLNKPTFFIYMVTSEKRAVLDHIEVHKKMKPNSLERGVIVVSESKNINSFALSLEGDIDSYIVEPFTQQKITTKLKKIVTGKNTPNDYQILLSEIEEKIIQGKYDVARDKCKLAARLHPRPATVKYFEAQADFAQEKYDSAVKHLIKGLQYNKDHYRCLLLLHDTYVHNGEYDKAYEVLKVATEKYPLGNTRVLALLKNGIALGKFKEIEMYASKILEKGTANNELVFFCNSCLLICSKHAMTNDTLHAQNLVHRVFKFHNDNTRTLKHTFKVALLLKMAAIYPEILKAFKDKSGADFEYCRLIFQLLDGPNLSSKIKRFEEDIEKVNYDADYYNYLKKLCLENKDNVSDGDLSLLSKLGSKYGLDK